MSGLLKDTIIKVRLQSDKPGRPRYGTDCSTVLPVHGGIGEGGPGDSLILGLAVPLSALAGSHKVSLVGGGGSEGQAGTQGARLVC